MPEFKRRERKHRKRARTEKAVQESQENGKDGLQQQSGPELTAGFSGKKRKRLEKYIENKLRKEENLNLLKKLASRRVDTSLLQSSKNLGRHGLTKRETLAQALKNKRAGIADQDDLDLLYEPSSAGKQVKKALTNSLGPNDSVIVQNGPSGGQEFSDQESLDPAQQSNNKTVISKIETDKKNHHVAGTGLKRPLELDKHGNPIIKKRQRLNRLSAPVPIIEEPSWDGFSENDSAEVSTDDESSDGNSIDSDDSSDYSSDNSEDASDVDTPASYPLFSRPQAGPAKARIKPRAQSEFKTWATQQINEANDFQPLVSVISQMQSVPQPKVTPRPKEEEPLPPELQNKPSMKRQVYSVDVKRAEAMQKARLELPILAEEQRIMEAIYNHPVVIIRGATGSGKTTQVPQFLYEAGFGDPNGPYPGLIGVTQPRRVAAVTVADRVAEELNAPRKSSYQIRYDATVGPDTAIKFMTDGILPREISQDPLLRRYSAIVIDEAHERSINTDLLIVYISRIIALRERLSKEHTDIKSLKLVIMSATLSVDSFLDNPRLFPNGKPPIVESEGRQFDVTTHFCRRTPRDYLQEAYKKIVKGHRQLPSGAILVFLTGQKEIHDLSRMLRKELCPQSSEQSNPRFRPHAKEIPLEEDDLDLVEEHGDDLWMDEDKSGDEDEENEFVISDEERSSLTKVSILPLYAQLPTKEQKRVFEPIPEDTRLIILATNVAETSITIPGIRYVFDCGRLKAKKYDRATGLESFEVGWISKASALQRAGRAGRTRPGHCYALYSSAMYERDFSDHTEPEILRAPLEGVILKLKSMGIDNITSFPFPTPPETENLEKTEKTLMHLGALDKDKKITTLGRELSLYPIPPRFAKMLTIEHQQSLMYVVAAMVAALAVPELLITQAQMVQKVQSKHVEFAISQSVEERNSAYGNVQKRFSVWDPTSDALKLTKALCDYMSSDDPDMFCIENFLNAKAMREAQQLYTQLLDSLSRNLSGTPANRKTKLSKPSDEQISTMKRIAAAGFLDQIAIRADETENPPALAQKPTKSTDVPYLTLFPSHVGRTDDAMSQLVYIHPSSVLAHGRSAKNMPRYLIYSHLHRSDTATTNASKTKTRMYPLTAVSEYNLFPLAKDTPLLEFGKPLKIDQKSSTEREIMCVPILTGGPLGRKWPLLAVKATQKKNKNGLWEMTGSYLQMGRKVGS